MKKNRASSTAFTVLQGILYTVEKPAYRRLVSRESIDAARRILSCSEEGRRRLKQLDSRLFRMAAPLFEGLMVPGISRQYVLRKRCIEDYTLRGIGRGVKQVVNLGAGFDTLAFRLSSRWEKVRFLEVDHPATGELKRRALWERGTPNLGFIASDLTARDLLGKLRGFPGFNPARSTLFIAEGVLMYLDELHVAKLLETLGASTDGEQRFIFSFVEPAQRNLQSRGGLLRLYLKFKGEPLLWAVSREKLGRFLGNHGYALKAIIPARELKKRYLTANRRERLHEGELIAVAGCGG